MVLSVRNIILAFYITVAALETAFNGFSLQLYYAVTFLQWSWEYSQSCVSEWTLADIKEYFKQCHQN